MTRFTTLTLALLAAGGLTLAGCDKRDDMAPTGAGPGTTTTPSTIPSESTGTPGSMSPTTPVPSASAASQ
ncbi:hypothetical protein LRS03_16805 [Rhizobacter sp. J219]|uniref:hypothetical protein n=1 Tax=Rhizobacter sp. J219 TaxID=2898430 RepID=UPI002151BDB6|nr:hypothetical protein [Rhizobacter sp. J219]MCR5884416.1 hypothetical protein [Rhizobacter sp. J219]